jgi:hypothetical protein
MQHPCTRTHPTAPEDSLCQLTSYRAHFSAYTFQSSARKRVSRFLESGMIFMTAESSTVLSVYVGTRLRMQIWRSTDLLGESRLRNVSERLDSQEMPYAVLHRNTVALCVYKDVGI